MFVLVFLNVAMKFYLFLFLGIKHENISVNFQVIVIRQKTNLAKCNTKIIKICFILYLLTF